MTSGQIEFTLVLNSPDVDHISEYCHELIQGLNS